MNGLRSRDTNEQYPSIPQRKPTMKHQRPVNRSIVFVIGAIALIAGYAADARPISGAGSHVSMNNRGIAPRTNFNLPHKIPVRKNVQGHCVLKFIPRVLAAEYSGRPHGNHGYGWHRHSGNAGKPVYEQKLVCE